MYFGKKLMLSRYYEPKARQVGDHFSMPVQPKPHGIRTTRRCVNHLVTVEF